jgi:peptidoglycan/xylan/chitin deacetylase (PgdA/CDA1 family)
MHKIFLTFDTEDFTNTSAFTSLHIILEMLKKYDFRALFFITGHVAEKLENFPTIMDLLEGHEIGYHSSGHSVRPAIFEFTDVENYEKAYQTSLKRETSHINPLTGEIEGKGGILLLRDLFPSKQIVAFRAPGCCWSPPHTEALRDLGIRFDFSSHVSPIPVYCKDLIFYPYPILAEWKGKLSDLRLFWIRAIKNRFIITGLHPSLFMTYDGWDTIYRNGNPKYIVPPILRNADEVKHLFRSFDLFLKQIKHFEKMRLIEVASNLIKSQRKLTVTENIAEKCYEWSVRWAIKAFHYKPRFLRNHFFRFFNFPFPATENEISINQ